MTFWGLGDLMSYDVYGGERVKLKLSPNLIAVIEVNPTIHLNNCGLVPQFDLALSK